MFVSILISAQNYFSSALLFKMAYDHKDSQAWWEIKMSDSVFS